MFVSPSSAFTFPFSSETDSNTLQDVVPTAIILPPFFFVLFIISYEIMFVKFYKKI